MDSAARPTLEKGDKTRLKQMYLDLAVAPPLLEQWNPTTVFNRTIARLGVMAADGDPFALRVLAWGRRSEHGTWAKRGVPPLSAFRLKFADILFSQQFKAAIAWHRLVDPPEPPPPPGWRPLRGTRER